MKLFQCIACILVVFLLGCTNDEFSDPVVDTPDTIQDCFFTNDCLSLRIIDHSRSSNHLIVDRTIEYFNDNHNEKNKMENKYGYPVWDAFYEELSSDIEDGLIPIIDEDSELVEAVLYVKLDPEDDQLYFRTIDRKDIKKLLKKIDKEQKPKKDQDISRELTVGMFLHFDSFLFGHSDCELITYAPSGARRDKISTRDEIQTCIYEYGYITECYYYEIGGEIYATDCTYTPYSETILCYSDPSGTIGQPDEDPDPTNTTSDGSNHPGSDPCEDADCFDNVSDDPNSEQDDIDRSYIRNGAGFDACGEESFNFIQTGVAGYTASVKDVFQGYLWGFFNVETFKISSLCIQTPNHINGSPIDEKYAAELTADAWDRARYEIFGDLQLGLLSTGAEAKNQFRIEFLHFLRQKFNLSYLSQNVTVSYSDCSNNNIPSGYMHYKIPYIGCIKSQVK